MKKQQTMTENTMRGLDDQSLFLSQTTLAEEIAAEVHADQFDKSNKPYIAHPQRVANNFDPIKEPIRHAAGWLHDTVEDSDGRVTTAILLARGVLPRVVEIVDLLTHKPGEDIDEYYEMINADEDAREVKLADITDNTDPERHEALSPETRRNLLTKYAHALDIFGEDDWADKLRARLEQL